MGLSSSVAEGTHQMRIFAVWRNLNPIKKIFSNLIFRLNHAKVTNFFCVKSFSSGFCFEMLQFAAVEGMNENMKDNVIIKTRCKLRLCS